MSFIERLKAKAAEARDVVLHEIFVEDQVAAERLEICKACPAFVAKRNQCRECGCIMTAKTRLKGAKCPLGKW